MEMSCELDTFLQNHSSVSNAARCLSGNDITVCEDFLNKAIKEPLEIDLNRLLPIIKCFRNACVNNEHNQNLIQESEIPRLVICIDERVLKNPNNHPKNSDIQLLRCSVQFFGNLIVQNAGTAKHLLRTRFFNIFSGSMLLDNKLSSYFCMVTYNCILDTDNCQNFLMSENSSKVISSLLNNALENIKADDESSIWWLLIIERFTFEVLFLKMYFDDLQPNVQCLLLDVMASKIEGVRASRGDSSANDNYVPYKCIEFFMRLFINKLCSTKTSAALAWITEEKCRASTFSKMLVVICEASCHHETYSAMREDRNFVVEVVAILRAVHSSGAFSKVVTVSNMDVLEGNDSFVQPTQNFKRRLIQLIGNLSFRNPEVQKLVHEAGGMEVVMDCCQVDARNPFLTQWAVLALRNLCEGCPENQELVAGMQCLSPVSQRMDAGMTEPRVIRSQDLDQGAFASSGDVGDGNVG